MIAGIAQMTARLTALPGQLSAAAAEAAAHAAASAAEYARCVAPVDSGELRAGISSGRTGTLSAAVRSSAPHSAMVEYGTSKMAPQPYMLPAAQATCGGFFLEVRAQTRCIIGEG